MSKIILPKEIKAEFKILFDGSSVTSIRGAARLAGVDHSVLSRHFAGGDFLTSKLAQKLIKHGFDPGDFFEGIPKIALSIILEYYAFDAGTRCTEQAQLVYRAFASIGIKTWLQEQLSY